MIIPERQKQEPEKLYKFVGDRELTAGEKEMYELAENFAEKIHYAGLAAAVALFKKMTYKEFKKAYRPLAEGGVKPEALNFFQNAFYKAYCNGYEEGEEIAESLFDEEQKNSAQQNC